MVNLLLKRKLPSEFTDIFMNLSSVEKKDEREQFLPIVASKEEKTHMLSSDKDNPKANGETKIDGELAIFTELDLVILFDLGKRNHL